MARQRLDSVEVTQSRFRLLRSLQVCFALRSSTCNFFGIEMDLRFLSEKFVDLAYECIDLLDNLALSASSFDFCCCIIAPRFGFLRWLICSLICAAIIRRSGLSITLSPDPLLLGYCFILSSMPLDLERSLIDFVEVTKSRSNYLKSVSNLLSDSMKFSVSISTY